MKLSLRRTHAFCFYSNKQKQCCFNFVILLKCLDMKAIETTARFDENGKIIIDKLPILTIKMKEGDIVLINLLHQMAVTK